LLSSTQYDALKAAGKTLLNVIEPPQPTSDFQVADDDLLDIKNVDDYTHRLKYIVGNPEVEFRLLAGDFGLAKLHLRERDQSLRVPRKRFAKFIDKARSEYDAVVLDCNPATSFLTRSALEVSSHFVIPLRPDRYSLLGAEMLFEFMEYLPSLAAEPKKCCFSTAWPVTSLSQNRR
jgi:chromosome partitioning protein